MLEGEWAYLNRPERLSILSERFFSFLELMPLSAENFANFDVIRINVPGDLSQIKNKNDLDEVSLVAEGPP